MFAGDSKIPITSSITILANSAHAADHVLFKTCGKKVNFSTKHMHPRPSRCPPFYVSFNVCVYNIMWKYCSIACMYYCECKCKIKKVGGGGG